MEMTILQLIQSWHNPILDRIMVLVFNDFVGAKGELWLIIGLYSFLSLRHESVASVSLSAILWLSSSETEY